MSSIVKIISERGSNLILKDGFKYRFQRKLVSTDEENWRCTVNSCKGTIFTFEDGGLLSRHGNAHNHEPNSDHLIIRQRINNGVKRKAVENIDERPAKLVHKELLSYGKTTLDTLTRQDIKLISNTISRERNLALPKLPKSSSEVSTFKPICNYHYYYYVLLFCF